MIVNKNNQFAKNTTTVSGFAKALSHPARIAILMLLIKKKACICGDIVDELPLSQSTVSQHLKELKRVGLIKGEISGAKVCYCIDELEWKKAQKMIHELFESYQSLKSCC
jgi:DNA-binding transcriptional ArsR family regulator